jgi:hypothetical protein
VGQQVFTGLDDMQKAADAPSCQGAFRHDQFMQDRVMGRIIRQTIGFLQAVEGRPHDGMQPEGFNPLPVDKDNGVHAFQRLRVSRSVNHGVDPCGKKVKAVVPCVAMICCMICASQVGGGRYL